MAKIVVKIPDNLTKEQEIIAIAKKLHQKNVSGRGTNREQLKIGTEVKVLETETEILIQRVSHEKPIEFVNCPVCTINYQSNTASYYFTNYGGNVRKNPVCSKKCVQTMVDAFPGRVSANKKKLTPIFAKRSIA